MAECSARNAVLLEGSFAIYPKTEVQYHVAVTNSEIFYVPCEQLQAPSSSSSKKSVERVIKFSDVTGVDCMRGKTSGCFMSYLNVYSYPHQKKFASSGTVRKRHCFTLVFSRLPTFEENYSEALHWQLIMTYLIRRIKVQPEGKCRNTCSI